MIRLITAMASLVVFALSVQAGPMPWTYSVWLKPAGGSDGILLGNETLWSYDPSTGMEKYTPYHVVSGIGKEGYLRTNTSTPTNTVTLFDFGYGDWTTKESLPTDVTYAQNRFILQYLFTDRTNHSVSGSLEGTISASGIFTTGTGNFLIGLDGGFDASLSDGRAARVQFAASNHESHSAITMQVTPVLHDVPEPATIALAGMGLAGVLGRRGRALRKRESMG